MEGRELVLRSARCRPVVSRFVRGSSDSSAPPRAMDTRTRRSIAVCIWPGLADPASSAIIRGVRAALDVETYRLLLETPNGTSWKDVLEAEFRFLERIAWEQDCAGVLLYYLGGTSNVEGLKNLRATGIPVVFLDRRPPKGVEADHVGVDNVRAAQEAVHHLISLGHRRIAYLSNTDVASTVSDREAGYRRALRNAGIPFRPQWVVNGSTDGETEERLASSIIAERMLALLKGQEPPTAVFCVNDIEAYFLLDLLKREGIRVPDDLSIIGFDGVERWRPGTPYLTTMYQPFDRIGECGAELLLERISSLEDSGSSSTYRHVLLNASLIEATTTAPPARGRKK